MKKILALVVSAVMLLSVFAMSVCAANIYGDIFTDGRVDSKDAIKLAQYFAKWNVKMTGDEMKAADVFKDGSVDSKDAVKLAQYLAKWDVVLGDGSTTPSTPSTPPSTGGEGDNEIPWGDIFN
ncbi:MAG: hypothetical protein E7623_02230 [Ruminococcaceae bacterium]|nr:hypothetical protein [Oscillospiraceae bacterium]